MESRPEFKSCRIDKRGKVANIRISLVLHVAGCLLKNSIAFHQVLRSMWYVFKLFYLYGVDGLN